MIVRSGVPLMKAVMSVICLLACFLGHGLADTVDGTGNENSFDSESLPPIERLSDVFRYSPSSEFAPGDGGVCLDWVDDGDFEVIKVTTLSNEGEGSLRWALKEKNGHRLVVFEVGGVVDLEGESLSIMPGHGNVIIAVEIPGFSIPIKDTKP